MKNYKTIIAAVAAGLGCSVVSSQASLTHLSSVNTTTYPNAVPTTSASDLGTLVAGSTLSENYSFGGGVDTGNITSAVYTTDTDSGALSGYAFVYTITVATGDLASFSPNGFSANLGTVAVGSYGGASPLAIGWNLVNGVVDIEFQDNTLGGQALDAADGAVTIVVDTTATYYGQDGSSITDNAPPGDVPVDAPVPEPTTALAGALMLLPLGVSFARSLRKDRSA